MSSDGKYVKVFWSIVDDPKFVGVYDDDAALATWIRLLLDADASWPSSAAIPANAKHKPFAKLVNAGIVDVVAGQRFRIHGLDAERNARASIGRNAAALRWHSERTADPMPTRAEQSKAEQSTDARADLEAFLEVRYRPPTPAQRNLLDAYCRTFDVTGPERAARLILSHPDDPIGAVKADLEQFRQERAAEAAASEVPKPQPHRPARGLTGVNAELAAMLRAQEAERG